jgi:hypothetical protein
MTITLFSRAGLIEAAHALGATSDIAEIGSCRSNGSACPEIWRYRSKDSNRSFIGRYCCPWNASVLTSAPPTRTDPAGCRTFRSDPHDCRAAIFPPSAGAGSHSSAPADACRRARCRTRKAVVLRPDFLSSRVQNSCRKETTLQRFDRLGLEGFVAARVQIVCRNESNRFVGPTEKLTGARADRHTCPGASARSCSVAQRRGLIVCASPHRHTSALTPAPEPRL